MSPPAGAALVLSGGGARAAYQVGVLQAIAERRPETVFPILTGVSAGAINAAFLAGHPGPLGAAAADLRRHWCRLSSETIYGRGTLAWLHFIAGFFRASRLQDPSRPADPRSLFDTQGLREFLERSIRFDGIDRNLTSGRLRAAALTATSYATGDSVTFIHGAPAIPLWSRAHRRSVRARFTVDHVLASAAIPIVFPAVRLDGGYFGDGSVRQTFPLSPAVHLGADRILAIATRPVEESPPMPELPPTPPSPARAMALLLDSVFMDHLDADAEVLGQLTRLAGHCAAGGHADPEIRPVGFFMLRPSRDLGDVAAEWAHGLPRSMRLLFRQMGGTRRGGEDFLSYLVFDPGFTEHLMELGLSDGRAQWPSIERLLSPPTAGGPG
jgi:NTE family protein